MEYYLKPLIKIRNSTRQHFENIDLNIIFPIGKDDTRSYREFLTAIDQAVTEKVAVIISSSNFFAVLSDGSQARKTQSDKEMVMVRLERNGKFDKLKL